MVDTGRYQTLDQFETIMANLQFSNAESPEQQILDFIEACNKRCQEAMVAGDHLTVDESMVKAFHRGLKGKMKIIRKPRPIGNEFKNLCDARSYIVLNMELYEGKEYMKSKENVKEYGATCATTLRLTKPWKGTGRVVIGDSWFGSINTTTALMKENGLYAIMIVKTAHKKYPRFLLKENDPARGEWNSATSNIDGIPLLAVCFKDLQVKQFISSCSTSLPGEPRMTKHHGPIKRPQVAERYLKHAAGIDIHNHVRTGGMGLEDAWMTKNYINRQFAGVLGFVFSNAYLAMRYFFPQSSENFSYVVGDHTMFKMALCNHLIHFAEVIQKVPSNIPGTNVHKLKLLDDSGRKQARCYYCYHGRMQKKDQKTSYYCLECGISKHICAPTTDRDCFTEHLIHGMPNKQYRK